MYELGNGCFAALTVLMALSFAGPPVAYLSIFFFFFSSFIRTIYLLRCQCLFEIKQLYQWFGLMMWEAQGISMPN